MGARMPAGQTEAIQMAYKRLAGLDSGVRAATTTRWTLAAPLALLLSFVIAGCGGGAGERVSTPEGGFTRLSADELATMLESKDFVFVNVHIPYEGELTGTDAFIPFDTIGDELDQLPSDKSTKIVLYCRSGRMSSEAADDLVRLGFTNVWELGGGMNAWEAAGRKLVQTGR